MRKHFLLLLLMTLLPLAGWATDYEVQVTTYDGTATWTGAKPDVQPDWFSASFVGGGAPSAAQKAIIATGLKVKDVENRVYNAGTYEYQLALKGGQTISDPGTSGDTYKIYLNSSTTATLTINKILTAPTVNATGLEYVAGDLTYDGSAHALLATGATAQTNAIDVPVVYATSETAETWYSLADLKETNAGTYTVYYKVAETINYAGSDPVAMATTKAIDKATITFNLSAATGLTYNGAPQALLALTDNTKPATNFGANTLQYKIDAADWAELPEAGIAGITGTSAKNGVAYSINLKVPADENGNWDETTITAPIATTIAKATPIFTYVPTHENGGLPSGLVYDTHSHQLVLQEATAIVENTEISVPLKYSIRRYKNVTGTYTSVTVKPFNELVGTVASNNYMIKAYNDETEDLNQVIETFENIVIAKATIPADAYKEPEAKNVRTTGAAQDLVDAATWTGETTYGTFQYSLTNNGTDWSNVVPQGTDVAEYTVYWRILPTVVSDTRNYDIVSGNTTSNITAKSKVTVTTVANQSFGYGTTPTIQKTVEWEEKGSDALNEAGLAWAWYTDDACNTPAVANASGYYTVGDYYVKASGLAVTGTTAASQEIVYVPALVKITAGQVNATISGTATYGSLPTFILNHVSGLSDTEAATFNATNNLSKVTVKQGTTTVLDGVNKDADELKTLNAGTYTLEATASCDDNNYVVVVSAGTLTVNPDAAAEFTVTITAPDGGFVYTGSPINPEATAIAVKVGTTDLTSEDYEISYGENNTNAGTGSVTITGKGNYLGVTKDQTFAIGKANLTITADNFTGENAWTYGTTEPAYTVTVDGLKGNDALTIGGTLAGIEGTLKVKRTSNETVGMHTDALVAGFYDAGDNEIGTPEATNYNLAFNPGDLQVAKGAVVIQLKQAVTATYGDNPATSINAAIKDISNYEYVSGLSELEAANFASIINVGAATHELVAATKYEVGTDYTFEIAGATSTNYGVTINPGTYNVTAADITLYADNQTINWATDPTATPNKEVSAATVIIAKGELKYAGTDVADALTDVVASIDIASQNVGDNKISLTAAENANYNIIVNKDADNNDKFGNLAVTGAATLEMTSDYDANDDWFSTIQSYDGKPVTVKLTVNRTQTLASGKTYTWKGEEWNAFILPFDITPKELSEAFGYAIVNVVNPAATSGNNVAFKLQMSGTIEANTPFMLKNYEAVAPGKVITFTKTIKAPANAEVSVDANTTGDIKFIGSYNKKTIDNTNSNLYYYNGEGAWKHLGATSTNTWNIAPFNAYIETPATVEAREFTFTFEELDGGTTAIRSISEDATGTNAKGWYNLKGMKMENAPTQKGVYIKDGKKVVIK